jgi:ascorbate-specific PTS system EIIC-type component UlaA
MGYFLITAGIVIPFGFDEKNNTETLYGSLPLKRETVVRGRYLMAGILILAGNAALYFYSLLIQILSKNRALRMNLDLFVSTEGVVLFLSILILSTSLILPLLYRFGAVKGILSAGMILVVLAALLMTLVFPWLHFDFWKNPASVTRHLHHALRTPLVLAAGVILVAAAVFISLKMSVAFYERREL